MGASAGAYDLGNLDSQGPQLPRRPAPGRPVAAAVAQPHVGPTLGWRQRDWSAELTTLSRTLTLFLPGAGLLLRGERARALCFLTWMGFLFTLGWSLLTMMERIAGTLSLLDYSIVPVLGFLGGLYVFAGAVHLTGVLWGTESNGPRSPTAHPLVTAIASLTIPGWGQLLNGDRVRAGLCLSVLWLLGGCWMLYSTGVRDLLDAFLPAVHPLEQAAREPLVRWTLYWTIPAVLWCLAVYDAVSSARWHRRDAIC